LIYKSEPKQFKVMTELSDYPKTHPETGKVKNPLTGNWIKVSYARREGVLEQAKEHTQQHFKDQDDAGEASEEINQLLQEAQDAEPGEAFKIDDEELERLDERADINHPEIPDSEFPNEEGFSPESEFENPPTPEGLDQAAKTQENDGNAYQGIYSSKSSSQNQRQQEQVDQEKSLQQKHEDQEVRYVKTEQGGMKMVYPNDE
jgi:hypothetical protein